MSKFFEALEQAERDRALRDQAKSGSLAAGVEPPAGQKLTAHAPEEDPSLPATAVVGVEEHLVSLLTPTSFAAEQYRALRHLVEQFHKSAELSVLAVSSPADSDGKTTTAINLAGALAQGQEARVLLVDADLRRASVTEYLRLGDPNSPGLVDAILNPALALEDVTQPCPPFNLSVVPAGRRPGTQYELLKSPRLGQLLGEARRRYEYVLLDTPPLVPVPDCRVIGKWVDAFVVVVAAYKTPRRLLEEALNVMDPSKIVGLIFNGDDRPLAQYYGYYGGADGRSRNGAAIARWVERVKWAGASLHRLRRRKGS